MSPTSQTDGAFRLTGRHVLFGLVAFFGLIVVVNVTMATFASGTWPGLVVANSYVESQRFNERLDAARRQQALGYDLAVGQAEGRLTLVLRDRAGRGVRILGGVVKIGRPVTRTEDRTIDVPAAADGSVSIADGLAPGLWIADIALLLPDDRIWRSETRISVEGGR